MKLLYLSCHAVLEYDEVKLFTELGIDVFSHGCYLDPRGHITLPRPAIPNMVYRPEIVEWIVKYPRTKLPKEFFDMFDVIVVMHTPDLIVQNWENMKHKTVVWRSIGQSTPAIETKLAIFRQQGLKVVRYSPKERNIGAYIGEDAMIRFYKDPEEFKGWTGHDNRVVNFTQSLLGRRYFCHYDEIVSSCRDLDLVIYGTGNEDLGALNGGELPYELMKGALRDYRAYVYGGTWPASYTLAFMEAWMTGIPVVAIGKQLAQPDRFEKIEFYEVGEMIEHGVSGFVANSPEEMNIHLTSLLKDHELAKRIGEAGRKKAIEYFGRDAIANQWSEFFKSI